MKTWKRRKSKDMYVDNAYYNYEVNDTSHGEHIKVFLYSDPAKTVLVSDQDIDVIYEYDFLHGEVLSGCG